MKAILDEMLAALSRGERVVLCSILASSGSVPRGAGAKMAVFEDGRVLGTIGGGAVERLSIQRAQDALKNGGSNELKSYNLHPSEVASTGMICGGAVTVYFQFFAPEQTADVAVLKRWREMLDRDVDLWLLLSLDGDGVNEFHVVTREEIPQDKVDYFSAKAVWKDGIYVEPLCHAGSVYIFGGGHVGRALVPVLATVGFRVVMYDNREELAKKENYPMASEVIFGSFSDISGKVALTANDYAVVMTPGHQGRRLYRRGHRARPRAHRPSNPGRDAGGDRHQHRGGDDRAPRAPRRTAALRALTCRSHRFCTSAAA